MSSDAFPIPRKLWEHPNSKGTLAYKFMQTANKKHGTKLETWDELHSWSVNHRSDFWDLVMKEHPIIHSGSYSRVVDEDARMDAVPTWFEGVKVNFAENTLFWPDERDPSKTTTKRKEDWRVACTEVREGYTEVRQCTWKELRERVALIGNAMRARGVGKGDRVAVVASNSFDTLTVFLAITSLGGIFSSSSTDMGTRGVLDRLRQIEPKYVFVDDWAVYNGKSLDLRPKMRELEEGMRGVANFVNLVSMPRWQDKPQPISDVPKCETMANFIQDAKNNTSLTFERINFHDPFLIVYSSGTTGAPKCITHTAGAILLNNRKEANLHRDQAVRDPDDLVVLQYTTTGWIMYLSSCLSLCGGARAILYDGSPFQPDLKTFIKLWSEQGVTDLGLSPRYFQTLATAKPPVNPRDVADLSKLTRVNSTGMVLSDVQFEWFYDHGFPAQVQLANIAGGTDTAACFMLDTLMKPLYVGGTQSVALGMNVEIYDQEIEGGPGVPGRALPDGEQGELVCTAGFPTQPARFWGDDSGERYFNAYYARFDNAWTHGDFISKHPKTGQVFVHGRADGVLNPSGVRFGSAEIYNAIDNALGSEVQDSICVGQRRPQDMDESVMLFLLMKPGSSFSPDLVKRVKDVIARDCGRRCVPKYIFETPEIPVSALTFVTMDDFKMLTMVQTTINLKKVELPVKQIVSGKTIKPSDTLANKDCLNFYYQFAKVEELLPPQSKL